MAPTVERKLTTILCADVCGYSRQMGKDEEGTLMRLKSARNVFSSFVDNYSGRIVNMTGDGIVAEFGSVVQAVHCAVDVQNHFNEKNVKSPNSEAMIFRIGLNLGDVIIEGEDIFGEGVNVAARLETMAQPGGICISGTVYDHVKGKFPNSFDFLGNKHVKNIEDAIPVYSLGLEHSPKLALGDPVKKPESQIDETVDPAPDLEEQQLRKLVKKQAAFYRRATRAGCLVFFLFLINIMSSPSYLWFLWPSLPIFLYLAMDAIKVFGKGHLSEDWEERKIAELRNKKQTRT
ncbi:MAG: adenylate/guanylate cyclase domain-containing protein [Sneathiella sp.]|nr:adenylate/guanylate cyclase domain-containing protein [Sneathiella sp.]